MRLLMRLICCLVAIVLLVSTAASYYQVQGNKRRLRRELSKHAEAVGEGLEQSVEALLRAGALDDLRRVVERFRNQEHLVGVAVYGADGTAIAATSSLNRQFLLRPDIVARASLEDSARGQFLRVASTPVHYYAVPLHDGARMIGGLLIVHDARYIARETWRAWKEMSLRMVVQIGLMVLATVLLFQRDVMRPIVRTAAWMRALRNGQAESAPPDSGMFQPLAREARGLAASLTAARASAEQEARLRDTAENSWTAQRLAVCLRSRLQGSRLFVVSNREPYSHVYQGKTIHFVVPASGLVTALEPILRACDGTWVAHGSGDADAATVDERNCLRVPPDDPRYTLRRVWLTREEDEGYYCGFANEGLWPLCHIAHTRPTFRAGDWKQYQLVNRKFADAVVEEMAATEHPLVIVQDYHFALLPKYIKQRRPDARVGIFWHIPWPNAEAFGICPWQRELLDGLLGADLVGFHVQYHCDNFLETVNRALEARVEWERFAVCRGEHLTLVRPFPISVAWPESEPERQDPPFHVHQAALLDEMGMEALYLGVGVDRVDYTKGILERLLGVERFLEKYPQYQGKFSFVQIGAPSRTRIKRYNDFLDEVDAEAARINARFQVGKWKPVFFRKRHHSHAEVDRFYRAADLCLVTSLHDGMNLVAKEYLASRDDLGGMLVLSEFTGAARELRDALIVNPYDVESIADAIFAALEMDPGQRRERMSRLREVVRQRNIYRWAASLIGELCDLRPATLRSCRAQSSPARAAAQGSEIVGEQMVYDFSHSGALRARGHQVGA
jgi:trehalose 6-phosphate synthase